MSQGAKDRVRGDMILTGPLGNLYSTRKLQNSRDRFEASVRAGKVDAYFDPEQVILHLSMPADEQARLHEWYVALPDVLKHEPLCQEGRKET
jgi:hypothetical protein